MVPTSSLLMLLTVAYTGTVLCSPCASEQTSDSPSPRPEWDPLLIATAVLSALLCGSLAAICLLTAALVSLYRYKVHRDRGQGTQAEENQYKLPRDSIRSQHIYSNIESLSAAARRYSTRGDSTRGVSEVYTEFSSPVTYEEIDMEAISCSDGRQETRPYCTIVTIQEESNYTTITDLTVL